MNFEQMDFVQRIENECAKHNTTITALLKSLNISPNKGSNWRKGSAANIDDISAVADALSVSIDYIVTGKNNSIRLTPNERKLLAAFRQLPPNEQLRFVGRVEEISDRIHGTQQIIIKLTSVKIYEEAAGAGISNPFSDDDKYTVEKFLESDVPIGTTCGIKVNGDSMEPDYPNGNIVWVNENADIKYGDPIIAILNGSPYFKIYERDGLHSLNPNYDVIKVNDDDSFRLFGKVIGRFDLTVDVAARSSDNKPSYSKKADISELYSANKSTDEY